MPEQLRELPTDLGTLETEGARILPAIPTMVAAAETGNHLTERLAS
jgi:hypothetical protein